MCNINSEPMRDLVCVRHAEFTRLERLWSVPHPQRFCDEPEQRRESIDMSVKWGYRVVGVERRAPHGTS